MASEKTFAEVYFESEQWEKVIKSIDKKWEDIKYRKEFGGIISATVFQDVMDHFEDEKGPDGAWAAWSKSYEKHMQRIGRGGNKKLQFNGRLRQKFTPQKWRAMPDGILFYNNAKTKSGFAYAQAHDEGGSTNGRPPKREFMWLSAIGIKKMVDRINEWLSEDK